MEVENAQQLVPPTLYSDLTFEGSTQLNLPEERNWKRITFAGASLACAATAVAFKVINFQQWNYHAIGSTALSFIAGAGYQNSLHYALNHRESNAWKSFLRDYSLPIFLILSQIHKIRDHPETSPRAPRLYSVLAGLGGMCTADFVHTLLTHRRATPSIATFQATTREAFPWVKRWVAWNVAMLTLGVGVFLGVTVFSQVEIFGAHYDN